VTAKKVAPALPDWLTAADRLRLYTAEEVIEMKLLTHTLRTLKDAAYGRRVPHVKVAGKVRFRLDHVWQIQQAGEVDPATRGRRRAA
jgi:hypothetical protein